MKKVSGVKTDIEISEIMGISRQAISNFKNQKAKPSLDKLYTFSKKYKTAFGWMLEGIGTPQLTEQQIAFSRKSPVTVERLKHIANLSNDEDLCNLLDIFNIQKIKDYQRVGECPMDKIRIFSSKTDIPLDSILYDEACTILKPSEATPIVEGETASVKTSNEQNSFDEKDQHILRLNQEISELKSSNATLQELVSHLQKTIGWQINQIENLEQDAKKYRQILEKKANDYDSLQEEG